ncbi:ectoine hydroxylase [Paenibacillus sp. J2TS4]|uniref:ectoine hydroxylase n=1 Tax=Paenibacillus sp. J2TS4 TaxID=2807194 RepID=UPI001B05EDA1|nr:ectoine hydroxylase [Paenibacillus sp. J2TS4]GIP33173.1 ectoine hydroxylase [Paenibacillus sp. J2TS4]
MSHTNTTVNRNDNQTDLYPSRIYDKPTITERKDPVVYPDAGFTGPLNKEQLDFFDKNGYLFLDPFFSEEETAGLKQELNKVWKESAGRQVPEVIREPGGDEVRSVFAVHRDNKIFGELSRNSRIVGAVQQILGSEVYVHQSRINFKPGFTGKEFYWHSDFETWHVEDGMPRMRALSCSVALEDNYAYNGALMVVPGSHKHYVSCVGKTPDDNFKSSLRKQVYGVPDDDSLTWLVEQSSIEMPTGKAGSILLFDCNIMHGSNSNITPYPRSNVFMVYNSVENKLVAPYSGLKPRPDYIATRD